MILHPCATWTDPDGVAESLSLHFLHSLSPFLLHQSFTFSLSLHFRVLSLALSSLQLSHSPSLTLLSLSLYCLTLFLSFTLNFFRSLSLIRLAAYAYKRALIQSRHRAPPRPLRRETPNHKKPRVFHVTNFGVDPIAQIDSTRSISLAIATAVDAVLSSPCHNLIDGVNDLGGAHIHLDDDSYLLSQPLRLPPAIGTLKVFLTLSIIDFVSMNLLLFSSTWGTRFDHDLLEHDHALIN